MTSKQHPEWELQCSIVKWFRELYPKYILMAIPNEATAKRSNYFKSSGTLKGAPDMVLILPEKVVFLECKSPIGRQSNEQVQFQVKVELLGFEYYIIRDLQDVKQILRNNLPLNEWQDL